MGSAAEYPGSPSSNRSSRSTSATLDWDAALARLAGRSELLKQMANMFATDCDRQITDLRIAIDDGDANAVARIAHLLKGSADWFAAHAAVASARRLEQIGQLGNLADAPLAFSELEWEMGRLKSALISRCDAGD